MRVNSIFYCVWFFGWVGVFSKSPCNSHFIIQQATELAEYTAKIALLEEARKRKESEVEEWQIRVSICFTSCSKILWFLAWCDFSNMWKQTSVQQ